ncbi:tetratricopeptide repeat protein [Luteitalea sp. TBR-22]|uniref:tetratricopeptide repeat protein n=1 Tax=Luteitalea sp. TBR-22 TaxID=2802971 RepID=UPI001EF6A332|nr:tetratricopeptide repeat protein [Luteitalea sp. TBR-22]
MALWLLAALAAAWWMAPRQSPSVVVEAARLQRAGRVEQAAALLRGLSPADLRDPAVLELLGGVEQERGRRREAEAAFVTALRLDPSRTEARLGLATALLGRGASREALPVLAAVEVPDSLPIRHRWLSLVAQSGDPAALAEAAARTLSRDPRDVVALGRALEAAMQAHQWPRAIELGTRLASVDPAGREAALNAVATAQEASGDLTGAYETWRGLGDRASWRSQARVAAALGRTHDVIVLWEQHPGETPTAEERAARAWAMQQAGRAADADADYRVLLAQGALTPEARIRYAWSLAERGRRDEAARVAAVLPITPASRELITFTSAWAGDDARAATLLPAWLEAHPRDAAAWALLAEVARRRGDDATRTRALAQLAAVEGGSGPALLALARHLSASGQTHAAIAAYERAVHAGEKSPEVLDHLSVLLEQQGRTRAAIDVLQRLDRAEGPSAERLAREARLWRRAGDPRAAVDAWTRAVAARPSWADDPATQAEIVRAHADAASWDAAAKALPVALRGPVDPDLLRVAADVETHRGQAGRAVDHLLALSRHRSLTPDERRWLAGQAEAAQRPDVALAEYDRLLAASPSTAGLWIKIAELETQRGRHGAALDAWRQVPAAARGETYWRQYTWAAARVGGEAAMAAYDEAWSSGHADAAQCLEAARLHAAANQPLDALAWYERHLAAPGSTSAGLELELARAHLGAGHPADAARWASRARADASARTDALYVEAQARHLAGEPREAAAILEELLRDTKAPAPVTGEWLAWLARTAQARGRTLEAYVRFGEALARGAAPASEFWLARGDLAHDRGDLWRARQDYTEASRTGAEEAASRLEGLAPERRPLIGLPTEVFWDTNDFRHASAAGRFSLWPTDRARVTGEWATGRVSQGATEFDRSAGTILIDRLYPTARTTLGGQVGVEQARGRTQPLWRVDGAWHQTGGQAVQVEAFRESPWRAETWDARMRYNRITDLASIPGDFHATGVRVGGVLPITDHQELQGNVAMRDFSDGNRQSQAYLQYQLPLSSRRDTWVALQPYGYVEQWARPDPRYFSPEQQVTAGATLRAIVTRGPWQIDMSATPQYLESESRRGFGYSAVGSLRRDAGPVSVGVSGMVFDDRKMAYRVQRITLDVQVPIGR